MNTAFYEKLDSEDDPELWRVVLANVLGNVLPVKEMLVEVGRCSHWECPHKWRWTADGGFAYPMGYGKGKSVPLFDWSVFLEWHGEEWVAVDNDKSRLVTLRIVIPSRTRRHLQAAVHTSREGKIKPKYCFYGFRKKADGWQLTAVSDDPYEKRQEVRAVRKKEKLKGLKRVARRKRSVIVD